MSTPTPAPAPTKAPTPVSSLVVSVLYPKQDSEVEMGQPVKFIARVTDAQGSAVSEAQATITVRDPDARLSRFQLASNADATDRGR